MGKTNRMAERKEEFVFKLMKYMFNVLGFTADVIRDLADLHEEYEKEYEDLLEFRSDPSKILEELDKIEDEEAKTAIVSTLFKVFVKLDAISSKLRNVYFLSPDEKRGLAGQINDLLKSVNKDFQRVEKVLKK